MRKPYTLLFSVLVLDLSAQADTYVISIDGFDYAPPTVSVEVGGVITIEATPITRWYR